MKYLSIFGLVSICAIGSLAMVPSHQPHNPIVIATPQPAPTMAQDLGAMLRMINMVQIRQLVTRYLLNDAQFQSFVRTINSQDAFITYMRFRSQPEVMQFITWVQAQILASGGELEVEESEGYLSIINITPFWANTVFGWQGFVREFFMYFPQDMLRIHINMKTAENGIFAQLWQRLAALKPVYERVIASPEAQRVVAELQACGIDVSQLDGLVRNLFGWQKPATVMPPNTPVSSSTEGVIASTKTTTVAPEPVVLPVV